MTPHNFHGIIAFKRLQTYIFAQMLFDIIPSDWLLGRNINLPDPLFSVPSNFGFPTSVEEFEAEVEAEYGFGAYDPVNKLQEELDRDLTLPDPFQYNDELMLSFDQDPFNLAVFEGWCDAIDEDTSTNQRVRKKRAKNVFPYEFGDVYKSNKQHDSEHLCLNGAIVVTVSILKLVAASATEAEVGVLYHNDRTYTELRLTLKEMGWRQLPTELICENTTVYGIEKITTKRQHSIKYLYIER